MKKTWQFTPLKVALVFVGAVGLGYWIGRSVTSLRWLHLEILLSSCLIVLVLLSCRRQAPGPDGTRPPSSR